MFLKGFKDFCLGPAAIFETDNPFNPEMRLCRESLVNRILNLENSGYNVTDAEYTAKAIFDDPELLDYWMKMNSL